jgi:hypothetical protein
MALAGMALGAQAQTKMYKCTGDGRTVYQQTACASAATATAASASADNAAPPARAGNARPTTQPARAAGPGTVASGSPSASADTAGRLATSRP